MTICCTTPIRLLTNKWIAFFYQWISGGKRVELLTRLVILRDEVESLDANPKE